MGEDEIFVKPQDLTEVAPKGAKQSAQADGSAPKPKKKLSPAQLAALAKGRERMAAKRLKDKEILKSVKDKEDVKVDQDNFKNNKMAKRKKEKLLHNQEKEDAIRSKINNKKQEKIKQFEDLKYSFMDKCNTHEEIDQYNSIFEKIDENMILDTTSLHKHLISQADKYRKPQEYKNVNNSEWKPKYDIEIDKDLENVMLDIE